MSASIPVPANATEEFPAAARARRSDLDHAKGLGILLVVVGHVVAREPPTGNEWYVALKAALYLFHMPFFMYLSGYVTFLSGAARTQLHSWAALASRRAERLLVPFLLFGLLIVGGKLVVSQFLHVDNPPGSIPQALLGLVWNTDFSPATSVWYIAVLFVLCVVTPPILRVLGGSAARLVAVAALLYVLPLPDILYLDRVGDYFLFFAIGGLAADLGNRWLQPAREGAWWALAALLGACVVFQMPWAEGLPPKLGLLVAGIISIPALHGLILGSALGRSRFLLLLGTFSFAIYLLNTVFIGLTKAVMFTISDWNDWKFLIYFPVLLASGIAGPLLLKRHVLQRNRFFDRMTS